MSRARIEISLFCCRSAQAPVSRASKFQFSHHQSGARLRRSCQLRAAVRPTGHKEISQWPTKCLSMRLIRRKPGRSEEHTSELQSLTNLVCRLLLEKKKTA